jgi:hypothetical protein
MVLNGGAGTLARAVRRSDPSVSGRACHPGCVGFRGRGCGLYEERRCARRDEYGRTRPTIQPLVIDFADSSRL